MTGCLQSGKPLCWWRLSNHRCVLSTGLIQMEVVKVKTLKCLMETPPRGLCWGVCSANDYVPVFESSSNTLTVQIVTDSARIPRSVFIFYYFFSSGTCKSACRHPLCTRPARAAVTPPSLGRWDLESVCFSRDRHLLKQWRFITNAHESHPESLGIGFLGPTKRFGFSIWGGAHEFAFLTSSQVRQMGGAEHLATGWRLLC